ncbi:MAG TPA: S8 family serine peptidase [Tepidisphaeraceae bacterium]
MTQHHKSRRRSVTLEALENRRLMDAAPPTPIAPPPPPPPPPWGDVVTLIRQDLALQKRPSILGQGQTIAIIDTGIDYSLESLGAGFGPDKKVIGGYDFVDDDADPMDTYGHGTNVAGVIAASAFEFNGVQYQGIAPEAKLVALRVDAADDPVPEQRLQAAFQWILDHPDFQITAVNISLGDGRYDFDHTSSYSPQLKALADAGIFIVAASGNHGLGKEWGIEYPAADPSVFSVAAVDSFDRITEFSARGHNLDYLAPGTNIPTISKGPLPYELVSGTSFAAPLVAGTVALIKQINPDLTVADLNSLLKITGVTNLDGDNEFGNVTNLKFPRLDVANALDAAAAWKSGPLDATGEVGKTTNLSMAYDPSGVLHLVYYDPKLQTLLYCVRTNDNSLSAPQVVDNTGDNVGLYVSMAIDKQGRPAVAYFDGSHGDLRFARFSGAKWDVSTIDAPGSCGLYPSLVYTSNEHALISYYHRTNTALRLAEFDGTGWSLNWVDTAQDVGRSSSMAISKTGEVAIAYENSTKGFVKTARKTSAGWKISVADDKARGVAYISLAFTNDNRPAMSYYDGAPANLKYAECEGKNWRSITLSRKGAQGLYSQLYFDNSGKPNIIYYNRKANSLLQITRAGSMWTVRTLQTGGGKYLTLTPHDINSLTYTWFRTTDGKMLFGELSTV